MGEMGNFMVYKPANITGGPHAALPEAIVVTRNSNRPADDKRQSFLDHSWADHGDWEHVWDLTWFNQLRWSMIYDLKWGYICIIVYIYIYIMEDLWNTMAYTTSID